MVTTLILGKQDEMISAVVLGLLVREPARGYIYLASDNGLELLLIALVLIYFTYIIVEFLDTHHVAMVGNGNALHPVGNSLVNEFLDGCLTVKDRILRMYV